MVAPDRETPGTSAQRLGQPHQHGVAQGDVLDRAVVGARPGRRCRARCRSRPACVPISHRLRKSRSITSLSSTPRTTIGSEPMMMNQPIRASRCPRSSGFTSERSPRRADPPDVLAEVDEHRELGADLDDRRERRARVAPAEQLGEDPQVGAAGDRQELGQALDQAEHHGLEEVHHGRSTLGRLRLCRHGPAARLGRTGLQVSRLGLGTMTWGRRHRRARGPRAAAVVRRGRRHVRRHRGGVRRRRLRGAARLAPGRRGRARRGGDRDQGRASRGAPASASPTPPAATCSPPSTRR